ncbi:CUAEP/CCAEP-tail radical SAM (seleno)protein [Tengunoibacter tsumagoiensis]|uniref:Radical SAM protein n=1 Tax=Tengunoibacter tsumagoiensis TaxID=2014871 RepID=A0A402A0L0_9CHLR|nr:CUAEP/CCAEP-tail radical SAM protein [Tengunoibacter tsumagoiensis]GCE12687.1 radical SAM protein [Tengunoibacter tsumagoiensis]
MRTPGAILLISCYELGHQPFHLASLSATLQQADYVPVCVDTSVDTLSDEAIRQARFVAISVPMHTALRLGEQIAQRIRQINPTAHICLYGLYALLNAEHLLDETINSAIGGEYETPLLSLITAIEQDDSSPVPGVYTRTASSGPWIERTPFLAPKRQQLPDLERYARLQIGNEMRLVGYTESTRGCKHTCLHCPVTPIYGGRFFAIPAEVVLTDIRTQVARGARHITFGDPDFWNGPTHALRILRHMHAEFPDLTFDATIKIEHLLKHQSLLPEMKTLGCVFIVSAVESLNPTVLSRLDKGHTASEVSKAFELAEQAGIALRPSLLPFSPWETLDSYIELLTFFEERHLIEHLDPVHLSIRLLIPPGSALLAASHHEEWLGELDAVNYTYRWQHPDPRMDELQQKVARVVELAESQKADSLLSFFEVKALALAAQGQRLSTFRALRQYGAAKVLPHLTESWFC